jgi:hypothetical protein
MKFKSKDTKLELIHDYDMLLMIEKGKRGGFSGVLGPRNVKAYNKYTIEQDGSRPLTEIEFKQLEKVLDNNKGDYMDLDFSNCGKSNFILYIDANNLYGGAMSEKLPTNNFKWENDPNYYLSVPEGRGCIIECDLEYTDECKELTSRYPLAPHNRFVEKSELSEKQINMLGEDKLGKVPKFILDLHDKEKYVIHNELLEYYIKMGMKVTKVYRTISFNEEAWLKPYTVLILIQT